MGRRLSWLGGAAVALLVLARPAPVGAAAGGYVPENLVSDQPGVAQLTDPQLVNPWGMSRGPTAAFLRDLGVRGEALPALLVPVEDRPNPMAKPPRKAA